MEMRQHSRVVREVVEESLWGESDLTIVDVGASGGVPGAWSAFQPHLSGVAFDPLVENMRRVAAADTRRRIRYEAAFVGCHDYDALFPIEQRRVRVDPFMRTSAVAALEQQRIDYVAQYFNEGDDVRWSERSVTLDDYFPHDAEIDFLKIDTDGSDLQVLLGAERLLSAGAVLGILVEAPFQGWAHDYANVFANIDRYLRGKGFALFDLDRNRYTRAALPGLFVYDIPAQTLTGQAVWGDTLYFRDLAHPEYAGTWRYSVTRARLLKLVALMDFWGLPDCAAEALLAHPRLTTDAERTRLLDLLVASAGFSGTYNEHLRRFETSIETFYPRGYAIKPENGHTIKPEAEPLTPTDTPTESRIAALEAANMEYKRQVQTYKQKLAKAREDRDMLKDRLRARRQRQGS